MSIYIYWIALNFMSIWSFQHYMPVYSPKNIKRKFCQSFQSSSGYVGSGSSPPNAIDYDASHWPPVTWSLARPLTGPHPRPLLLFDFYPCPILLNQPLGLSSANTGCHRLVGNIFLIIYNPTSFKVKIRPVQYRTFKGSFRFLFVR